MRYRAINSKIHKYTTTLRQSYGESVGKIRPTYIKRIAEELCRKFPDKFTTNFEQNKKLVDEIADVSTVKMRNRIAGYVTRYKVKTSV